MTHIDALLVVTSIGAVIFGFIAWGVGKIDLIDASHDHDQPAPATKK